jgi:hypothetical protein
MGASDRFSSGSLSQIQGGTKECQEVDMAYDRVQMIPRVDSSLPYQKDITAGSRPELCCGFNKSEELLAGGSIIRK